MQNLSLLGILLWEGQVQHGSLVSGNYFGSDLKLTQIIKSDDLWLYNIYAPFMFYNNDTDAIIISQKFSLFFLLVSTICQSHRPQQIIPETWAAFIKGQLSATEDLAANPSQLKKFESNQLQKSIVSHFEEDKSFWCALDGESFNTLSVTILSQQQQRALNPSSTMYLFAFLWEWANR